MRENLEILYEIDRKQAVETRPLEKRQLRQQGEQVRESYNSHREEYGVPGAITVKCTVRHK
jgi:hypothetical protein